VGVVGVTPFVRRLDGGDWECCLAPAPLSQQPARLEPICSPGSFVVHQIEPELHDGLAVLANEPANCPCEATRTPARVAAGAGRELTCCEPALRHSPRLGRCRAPVRPSASASPILAALAPGL